MKNLAELEQLREKLQREINVRQKEHQVTVLVSMGTCGIAAGGREVMKAILEELKEQGLKEVALTQTGCAGLCQHEPLMEIENDDVKTTYINVDRNKAKEIIKKHLVAGEVIEEWTNPQK